MFHSSLKVVVFVALTAVSSSFAQSRVYWTDSGRGTIESARLDGSFRQSINVGGQPVGLAIDRFAGKMYWTDHVNTGARIRRANLNGTAIENVLTGLTDADDIELDLQLDVPKMYWTDPAGGAIWKANLDGTNVEWVYAWDAILPAGLAIDHASAEMYWTVPGTDEISRGSVFGGTTESLISSDIYEPMDVELDLTRDKMYWTELQGGRIGRSNLDGSGMEWIFTSDAVGPAGLALDVAGQYAYFTDPQTQRIWRVNFAGTIVQAIATTNVVNPRHIELVLSSNGNP